MTIKPWPPNDLERVASCPICSSGERNILYAGLTDRVFCVADGEWNLYECSKCLSGYLDPRPTVESIGRAYSDYYTHLTEDHAIVRRVGLLRSVLHDLISGYQNKKYGVKRRPAHTAGQWLIPLIPSLCAAADAECRHLPKLPTAGGRLLDIGCGNGGFLVLAAQAGWHVEGIDFDPVAVATARGRGLSVRQGGSDMLSGEEEQFDVITLCHVIEHVHHPETLLRDIYKSLKPGGTLWLDTPNLNSVGARRFGGAWRDLDPPRHLVLFNPASLKSCLQAAGFTSLKQYWRGMSVFDVFAASEAIQRGDVGMGASHHGKPPFRDVLTELAEMFLPSKREFLTFSARK